jgi:UDP-N-acetylmuramate: L-alanyl-gamma-D-glutamyl-meso-diaminopimelate ligase
MQRVHFIAIGGAAMHNLAIVLKEKGYKVSGSDDEIYEPSLSILKNNGLLPDQFGWKPENINNELDLVILGMHAKADNPELKRALELQLPVMSYPEYIYRQSTDKQRVVIAGSHGKTTITAIIMHVLKHVGKKFDYMVGARLDGFRNMVSLTDAPVIIIEGDEYLASAIDRVPKFLHYKPHIALISGIAWDHINVYPEFELYERQFELLVDGLPKSGTFIYDENDDLLSIIASKERSDVKNKPYVAHPYKVKDGKYILLTKNCGDIELQIFGEHNMKNLQGAKIVLDELGILDADIYSAFSSFKGAAKRLEKIFESDDTLIIRDFAHAPSKVKATTEALRELHPERKLVACFELHTYSSLNLDFLPEYAGSLQAADTQIVFYSAKTLAIKNMQSIDHEEIRKFFGNPYLHVFTDGDNMLDYLKTQYKKNTNILLMSSGNFGGIDLNKLTE